MHAYDDAVALGNDPAQIMTAHDAVSIFGLVSVATWIVGALWLLRAWQNAAMIARDQMRRSQVWTFLGWIVPIVNFWFPKQIVDDTWRITAGALGDRGSPRSRYRPTGLWWGLWLVYSLLSNITARSSFNLGGSAPDPHQGVRPGLEAAVAIAGIVAYAVWIKVVLGLTRAQTELSGSAWPA